MTLIELLVAIVILVTVLGAVIPVISPNNDARRLRNGARQLQSMLAQAQALAAREGRPYGVAFKEIGVDADDNLNNGFETGDSTALEVYFISEPKPYTGFSEFSRVRMRPTGNSVRMQFVLAGPTTGQPAPQDLVADPFPPNFIRRGDRIEVGGVIYRLIDGRRDGDDQDYDEADFPVGDYYTLRSLEPYQEWICVPESLPIPPIPRYANGQSTPRPYKILRQTGNPAMRPGSPPPSRSANTSAAPLVMPRGVAIDMIASGTDVIFPDPAVALSPQCGFTTAQSDRRTALMNDRKFYPFLRPLTVGVLFAPSGRIETIWINGEKLKGSPDHLYLLVGRAENSLRSAEEKAADADFNGVANDQAGDADLLERRQRLNWLNGDSMWVTIAGHSGRILTSDNDISTDPRSYLNNPDPSVVRQLAWQIRDARELAQEMSASARQ